MGQVFMDFSQLIQGVEAERILTTCFALLRSLRLKEDRNHG